MSIKLLFKLPRTFNLAFSGGVDSLAAAHFFRNNHNVTLLHFNHGCGYSDAIEEECRLRAESLSLPIIVEKIKDEPKKGQSVEDYWRRNRYRFLRSFENQFITVHHIQDAVETWVTSSLHGQSKLIPAYDEKVLRPFLITEKKDLIEYSERHNLIPVDDPCNRHMDLTRNYIRANMMEHIYKINPGINKVIRKKYLAMEFVFAA